MTNSEIKNTLRAVINTLDRNVTVSGIANMNTLVQCTRAIEEICLALENTKEDENGN